MLDYHQERLDRSRKSLFPKATGLKLKNTLSECELPQTGLHKIRILYGEKVHRVEVHPYELKPVRTLKLINADHIRYSKKYADRSGINELVALRGNCDDVLMVQHGFITDTSYANVALFDGNEWYTPAAPLLRGTRRAYLLAQGKIKPSVIRAKDLELFQEIRLINGMIPWEKAPRVVISNVFR